MDEVVSPGALLGTKEELRLRFGVAAATVNEAVRLLEMRGLIAARPGRGGGIFVASNSPGLALSHSTLRFKGGSSRFPDYLAVRDALDPLICREAARNHAADDIHALEEDSRADGEDARRSALSARTWRTSTAPHTLSSIATWSLRSTAARALSWRPPLPGSRLATRATTDRHGTGRRSQFPLADPRQRAELSMAVQQWVAGAALGVLHQPHRDQVIAALL